MALTEPAEAEGRGTSRPRPSMRVGFQSSRALVQLHPAARPHQRALRGSVQHLEDRALRIVDVGVTTQLVRAEAHAVMHHGRAPEMRIGRATARGLELSLDNGDPEPLE